MKKDGTKCKTTFKFDTPLIARGIVRKKRRRKIYKWKLLEPVPIKKKRHKKIQVKPKIFPIPLIITGKKRKTKEKKKEIN